MTEYVVDGSTANVYYIGIAGNHKGFDKKRPPRHSALFNETAAKSLPFLESAFVNPITTTGVQDEKDQLNFRQTRKTLESVVNNTLLQAAKDENAFVIFNVNAHGDFEDGEGPYFRLTDWTKVWMREFFKDFPYQSLVRNQIPVLMFLNFCKCGMTGNIQPENTTLITSRKNKEHGYVGDSVLGSFQEYAALELLSNGSRLSVEKVYSRAATEFAKAKTIAKDQKYQLFGRKLAIDLSHLTEEQKEAIALRTLNPDREDDSNLDILFPAMRALGNDRDAVRLVDAIDPIYSVSKKQNLDELVATVRHIDQSSLIRDFTTLLRGVYFFCGPETAHSFSTFYSDSKFSELHQPPDTKHSYLKPGLVGLSSAIGLLDELYYGLCPDEQQHTEYCAKRLAEGTLEIIEKYGNRLDHANERLVFGLGMMGRGIDILFSWNNALDSAPEFVGNAVEKAINGTMESIMKTHRLLYGEIADSKYSSKPGYPGEVAFLLNAVK